MSNNLKEFIEIKLLINLTKQPRNRYEGVKIFLVTQSFIFLIYFYN